MSLKIGMGQPLRCLGVTAIFKDVIATIPAENTTGPANAFTYTTINLIEKNTTDTMTIVSVGL
mgnify:FL=1|jgi:hypothetical protein